MADQQHCARVVTQEILQQIQRLDVEVIGRLVQHQEVGIARHDPRQQQTRLFTARERADRRARLRLVKEEILEIAHHMARLAPHQDLIRMATDACGRVLGQAVPERLLRVELRAGLVEHRHLDPGAKGDGPGIGCGLTCQDIEKGRFSRAVGANKGHPVAAQDTQIEGLQDHPVAEAFGNARGLDHPLARGLARIKHHFGRPLAADHAGTLGPQILQRAHTALVALAPGADAFDGPACLGFDLAIKLMAGLILFVPSLVAPCLEIGKTAILAAHNPTVEPKRAARQGGQKSAVVADQHKSGARLQKFALKPADRLDVEMVGRLIEQHQFRCLGQEPGKCCAAALTT